MSHNPNTVKSQHEMDNQGMRSSDVLLEAISKAERLQKQLDIAREALSWYSHKKNWNKSNYFLSFDAGWGIAKRAEEEIKELDNEIHRQDRV